MKGGKKILRMINKKAQSQIITTVLIILLVLAAIVIVWQVVNTTVRGGSEEAASQASCIGLNLVVVKANATDNVVTVRRDPGGNSEEEITATIFVNGVTATVDTTKLKQLESTTIDTTANISFNADYEVQVAAVLSEGGACSLSSIVGAVA